MVSLPSFDEMKELAKDSDAFEEFRLQKIDEFILSLPEDKRAKARRAQWRLEQDLRKIRNPQVKLSIIYALMVDSLNKLDLALNNPQEYDRLFANPELKHSKNKIVSFNKERDDG